MCFGGIQWDYETYQELVEGESQGLLRDFDGFQEGLQEILEFGGGF